MTTRPRVLLLLLLGGCCMTKKRDYAAGWNAKSGYVLENVSDAPFSARAESARPTSLGDRELLAQGYIWVSRQVWLDDRADRMPSATACAREGALRGADLYRFASETRKSDQRGTVTTTTVWMNDYEAPTRHSGGYVESGKEVDVDRVQLYERDVDLYRRDPEKAAQKLKALDSIIAASGEPRLERVLAGWGMAFDPTTLGSIVHALFFSDYKPETFAALAKAGADLEFVPARRYLGVADPPVLGLAARAGRTDLMKVLLANGADPNFLANDNFALLEAARGGSLAAVRLLIEKGANVKLATKDGKTALSAAKTDEIAAFLRSKGAR